MFDSILLESKSHIFSKHSPYKHCMRYMNEQLIIAHQQIEDKTNEISVFQELMQNLDLSQNIYTADAMHCQKNARTR